ncbi:MAG: hypothetical protein AAGJ46_18465 [Planctomycetota bacterium]
MISLCRLSIAFCLAALAATPSPTSAAAPEELPAALKELANEAMAHARGRGYKNVGVLHFLVAKKKDGKDPPLEMATKRIGAVHHLLAKRFEIALGLANDNANPVGVVDDASTEAERAPGGALLNPEGRRRLARRPYRLHWGDDYVKPDAFFTGLMLIEEDLQTASLELLGFSTADTNAELYAIGDKRVVKVTDNLMPEIGESFSRGLFDGGVSGGDESDEDDDGFPDDLPDDVDPEADGDEDELDSAPSVDDEKAQEAASAARKDATKHPLHPGAEVSVKVLYDGRTVTPTRRDGAAFIPEPRERQRVTIRLTKDRTPTRYGVCVKLNGESTLVRGRRPDARCAKWILSDPGQSVEITGFTDIYGDVEFFKVLSRRESALRREEFGKDIGQITVTVFPERKSSSSADRYGDPVEKAIADGGLPQERPTSHSTFKQRLLGYSNTSRGLTRGIITGGPSGSRYVKSVDFRGASSPVMSLSLTYYRP